jgi:hypothetical protein
MRSHTPFTDLRQIRADQVAALVHAMCIALGAVAVELFLPFHHVCLVSVFFDEPADAVAALTGAFGAFDAQHVEFFFDVTEDQKSPSHGGDITTCERQEAPAQKHEGKSKLLRECSGANRWLRHENPARVRPERGFASPH